MPTTKDAPTQYGVTAIISAPTSVGAPQTIDPKILSAIMLSGDLSGLNQIQQMDYYKYRCQQLNLDVLTKPFDLLRLSGKLVLYANAGCTQQLAAMHSLSTQVMSREIVSGLYSVGVRVTDPTGRYTENLGVTPIQKEDGEFVEEGGRKFFKRNGKFIDMRGEELGNAMMKAFTKGARRAILSHCGLGMMDETEAETIQGAQKMDIPGMAQQNGSWTLVEEEKDEQRKNADEAIQARLADIEEVDSFIEALKTHEDSDDWIRRNKAYQNGVKAIMETKYPADWAEHLERLKAEKVTA